MVYLEFISMSNGTYLILFQKVRQLPQHYEKNPSLLINLWCSFYHTPTLGFHHKCIHRVLCPSVSISTIMKIVISFFTSNFLRARIGVPLRDIDLGI